MFIQIGRRTFNLAQIAKVEFVGKDETHLGANYCDITLSSGEIVNITLEAHVSRLKEYFTNDDHFINVVGCKIL